MRLAHDGPPALPRRRELEVGGYCSPALDSLDLPPISDYDETNRALTYTR